MLILVKIENYSTVSWARTCAKKKKELLPNNSLKIFLDIKKKMNCGTGMKQFVSRLVKKRFTQGLLTRIILQTYHHPTASPTTSPPLNDLRKCGPKTHK